MVRSATCPSLSVSATFAICAKLKQLMVNLWRESDAPPAAVYQEVVQILPQAGVVWPQMGDAVRNPRKTLKQCQWPDLHWKACSPSRRRGQLLVERLQPSPFSGV
jgi:hypothetical protein